MSVIFFDGFETVGTETGLGNEATVRPRINLRWDKTAAGPSPSTSGYYLIDSPTGSGYSWNQGKNKATYLRKWIPSEVGKTYVIGCNVHVQDTTDSRFTIFQVMGNTTSVPSYHIKINVENLTDIVARKGPSDSNVGSATSVMTPGAWHHVEAKIKVANSPNGLIEVNVNGTQVIDVSGIDTQDFYSNVIVVQFGGVHLSDTSVTDVDDDFIGLDDIYILKTEGVGPNDFLGSRAAVLSLPPNGDSTTQWSTSTGTTHYTLIDENGADSADYIEESTDTEVDMFDLTNLPNGGVYHALKVEVEAIDTATGINNMDVRVDSGGTVSETNFSVTDTANYAVFVHYEGETNPDTSTDWTETTINALLAGAQYNT